MKNFVNPKKIKGQDKLNRIKDLMGKMNTLNESTSLSEIENVKKGANGVIYGIVRENHSYFIKTTEKSSGTLVAEDFEYIGGLQNKNLERYGSYAEALKQLNLKFDMLNESFGVKSNNNLFESDAVEVKVANASGVVVKEDDTKDIEEQKKVIKVDAPTPVAPVEDEVEEVDVEEDPFADEEGGEEEVSMDVDVEEEGEDDGDGYTKKIQKLTGKIGQMLRDKDEPDAELDKYVINSIISAINWEDIPDEDVEDIIAKIEGEDEEDDELEGGGEETVDIDMDVEEEGGEDPFADEEGGEELAEAEEKEEEKETINISDSQMKKLKTEGVCECGDKCLVNPAAEGTDAKEILEKAEKTGKECIIVSEDRMKMLEEKGECSCGDVKLKCEDKKEKVEETEEKVDEGNKFSGERQKAIDAGEEEFEVDGKKYDVTGEKEEKNESKKFTKKQLMENFLKKNINESLNKILKENELTCEQCGKIHEGECGSHVDEELNITNDTAELAGDDVHSAPQPFGEQNMSVVDAIATGQNYLQASGDLDRDGDQIPNRLDMDSNMDGELDHETFDDEEFIEIDFDSLMGNSPAPVKEPGIAEPTTKPGRKKPRWKKIPKPNVNPKPKATDRRKFHLGRKGMYR